MLQMPHQYATSLTCASVSPPIPLPSMRCVRMKAWTGNTEAEQEQRLLRGFVLSLPQPGRLVVAPVTCGALGLSRLSEEQRASEEPFCLSTPPGRQSVPHTGRTCLPSHPASTHVAPTPATQHPGHLQSSSANSPSTTVAGAGALPCCRHHLLLLNGFHPSGVAALLSRFLPLLDSFHIQETCSFHFWSCRKAMFSMLNSSQGLKPLWRKGRSHHIHPASV